MRITSIELCNWRAYKNVTFRFDVSNTDKNCVVIGAPNGFRKTSLFEAITLCLYGQKGQRLLARASETGKADTPYNVFLSGVLHKAALAHIHSRRLAVKIGFLTEQNVKLRVERSWYFSSSGQHKPSDEEFTVWEDDEPKSPEPWQDRADWEAEIISRFFVNNSLARFFLFDGEMVRELAKMDMAAQVRTGISHLMGIPILRDLFRDLDAYATRKRSGVKTAKNETSAAELAAEIEKHRENVNEIDKKIAEIKNKHSSNQKEIDNLIGELENYGTTDTAKKSELYQRLEDTRQKRNEVFSVLQEKLVSDFSMGLVGRELLKKSLEALEGDKTLEDWDASKNQGEKGFHNFIKSIQAKLDDVGTDVPEKYHPEIINLVKDAWGAIWFPKPADCPDTQAFPELNGGLRQKVSDRLERVLDDAGSGLEASFREIDECERAMKATQSEIDSAEMMGPRQEDISERIKELNAENEKLNIDRGAKGNERIAEEGHVNSKNATLRQITDMQADAQPVIDMAKRAEHVSKVVRKMIEKIIPLQTKELAESMSEIYKELSNKPLVDRVVIDNDFNVRLLNKKQDDIRKTEMSAGEEQIFSQALISSVVHVSNFDFPMIIDTPLARLDHAHRKSILQHFKNSKRQTIFLSTDTEIVGEYFDLISDSVSSTYKLKHEISDGIGYTTVEEGYF